ncbi:hypothetical protein LAV77_02335 [Priestia megaterium]|uniref:hypothetical protein n=1 Tax=Priestia megaterium TaxID=1404 RepID=UPI002B25229A|nr:hypothetical protein [Priestia megaterium]MEB2263623.1 hypothetical protein [Priestia megaterium]
MSFKAEFTQKIAEKYDFDLREKLAFDAVQKEIYQYLNGIYQDLKAFVDNRVGIDIDLTNYSNSTQFAKVTIEDDELLFTRSVNGIHIILNNDEIDFLYYSKDNLVTSKNHQSAYTNGLVDIYLKRSFKHELAL